jgi:hypothetical protein
VSSDEDRQALERFVAGLPVDPDVLARAVTARAAERTVVIDALLRALAAPEPVARHRVARRAARMAELDPRLAHALTGVAAADPDARVRAACVEALREHGLPVPGESPSQPVLARRPWRVRLELNLQGTARGKSDPARVLKIVVTYKEDAPGFAATLREDGPDGLRVELAGLPPAFAGTRPMLRGATETGLPLTPIAAAAEPVSTEGDVTITIPASVGTFDQVARLLRNQADLVVLDVDDNG